MNCDFVMKELAAGRAIGDFRRVWLAALRADLRRAVRSIVNICEVGGEWLYGDKWLRVVMMGRLKLFPDRIRTKIEIT